MCLNVNMFSEDDPYKAGERKRLPFGVGAAKAAGEA